MPTVINNPGEGSGSGMGTGLIVGIVIAVLIVLALLFFYGLPALRGGQPSNQGGSINIDLPEQIPGTNGGSGGGTGGQQQ